MNESPNASGSPLRVGIIGAGKMAQHHARSIQRVEPAATVSAVADPSVAALRQMQEICPGAHTFETPEAMLEAGIVDVVHVCTPPATHHALALAVLEHGAHVYVEKPFVETHSEAAEVLELAESRNLKVCAGHQLLYEPPAREALRLLPALGALSHVESYFAFRTVRRAPGGRTPLRADLQLLDILPHPTYSLLHVLERAVPDGTTELTALEVGPAGTVHALLRRGELTGTLTVTLQGRPVESFLRLVGSNGSIHADFVRSTVQRLIGPGISGIDKLLNPYRLARQLGAGTTVALGGRFLNRQRSYPGLVELFEAFYEAIRSGGPSPVSPENILDTVAISERVAEALRAPTRQIAPSIETAPDAPRVAITGGTGFLGKEVVGRLTSRGVPVRVLSRREPPEWERVPGAEYVVADIGEEVPGGALQDVDVVIHAAAETAGGWDEHQKNSIDATEHMLRAAAAAGVAKFVHVSSLAVLASDADQPFDESTPLEDDSRSRGPYVWGKLESERLAVRLADELGIDLKVVRPGAIVDYRDFDPPGRLGKRVGNIFVAAGSPSDTLGVVDLAGAAEVLAWVAGNFDAAPDTLNLLSPELPTRRDLVERLRAKNPDLTVIWLPTFALVPASLGAIGLQKALRPGTPAMNVAKVFESQEYDTTRIRQLTGRARQPTSPERRVLTAR